MRLFGCLLLLVMAPTWARADATFDAVECSGGGVCRLADTGLPARVLTRPLSPLFAAADDDGEILISNLAAFRPWFVFALEGVDLSDPEAPQGWLNVGFERQGPPIGWLRVGDAMLWRNNLVVTYLPRTSFEGEAVRNRVLMFSSLEEAEAVTEAETPEAVVDDLLAAVDSGDEAAITEAGLVSVEPRKYLDYDEGAYLLPVIDFEQFELFAGTARYLRLAAAVPETASGEVRGPKTVRSEETRAEYTDTSIGNELELENLGLDIKFVVDMTGSMQPYVDAIRNAIAQNASKLSATAGEVPLKFGLVGYTDVPTECADCRFVEFRDFTADGLVDDNGLRDLLSSREAAAAGGGDWPETVFEGVLAAGEGNWSDNALKFVVLVGDASSNPFGTPKNTRLDADELRSQLNALDIRLVALHAKPARVEPDHPVAEAQFRTLAADPSLQGRDLYFDAAVDMRRPDEIEVTFREVLAEIVGYFADTIERIGGGGAADLIAEAGTSPAPAGDSSDTEALKGKIGEVTAAALMEIVGKTVDRQRDITVWTTDVDMADPFVRALDVAVLVEKRELSDLVTRVEAIVSAFRRTDALDSDDFFAQLQATMGGIALDRDLTESEVDAMAGSGMMPGWLETLPYRSPLMDLTADGFVAMSADDRLALQQDLDTKLELYGRLLESSSIWLALAEDAAELTKVYPLPLVDLP